MYNILMVFCSGSPCGKSFSCPAISSPPSQLISSPGFDLFDFFYRFAIMSPPFQLISPPGFEKNHLKIIITHLGFLALVSLPRGGWLLVDHHQRKIFLTAAQCCTDIIEM